MTLPRETPAREIRQMDRRSLGDFVARSGTLMTEEEALAVLANVNCSSAIIGILAQNSRLTSYYAVRSKLVAHKATPLTFSLKFSHFLYWVDLLRFSTDVRIPAPVRRALDNQLLGKLQQLALGEKITSAKQCSREIVKVLLFDPSALVFSALLINQRLKEEDLLYLISSGRALPHQLVAIGSDRRWSSRYAIRRALVLNEETPRALAASQLRFLSQKDLDGIRSRPATSVYLRRCIDTLAQQRIEGGRVGRQVLLEGHRRKEGEPEGGEHSDP